MPFSSTIQGKGKGVRGIAVLTLLCAAQATSGCSVALVSGPPPKEARKSGFTCSSSPVWPVTDIGLSLVGLAAGTYGMTKESNLAVGLGLGAAAAFGISAAVGAQRANACNRALGHPYVMRGPTLQPDMMPEMPFGTAGTTRSRRGKKDPDLEDTEEDSAAAPPPHSAGPALATPPPDL